MDHKMSPVIKAQELLHLIEAPSLILIDASAGPGARDNYLKKHLKGALYADLEKQLAEVPQNAANGGRHPLPDTAKFARVLGNLGISTDSHVIIYDDKNGANAAARLWWMLKAFGHEKVQVLDGGFKAALEANFPLNSGEENHLKHADYPAQNWQLPIANIEETGTAALDKNSLVIDVRDAFRYNGESEPIDLIAGHIPGAENIPFGSNLDSEGFFLDPSVLNKKYSEALRGLPPGRVIVHCGSGVTACHTLLAMDYAGLDIPKLYVGSWSEWSRNDLPIATKR
ncbi:sulfurtransferase [Pedobacter sp. HMF7647]|uniref:Sulfurtransferase n=1 Tax=Hufsiella arboris TaxID=2695275 RepID=A0A7K1Y4P1_9SPHI|nr:sulfurtransferase [Hufsiella arboris]MXV49546.1 sulfurtransferase [Hufsiella arboris]